MIGIVKIDFKNAAESSLLERKTRLDEAYATLTPAPHPARTDIAGVWRAARACLSGARGSGSPADADNDLPDRAGDAAADRQRGGRRRAASAIAVRAPAGRCHGCLSVGCRRCG